MKPRTRVLLALIAGLLAHPPAGAQGQLSVVRQGKAATALVVLPHGDGSASAFCIDPSGWFVTSAHVVDELGPDGRLTLVVSPGEAGQQVVKAWVVAVDARADLALLGAAGTRAFTALPLGDAATLVETAPVTAFGYPFGDLLATEGARYPNVSVNAARVTSLRRTDGRLEAIQIDSQLNPGSSGGPVVDARGNVVGIVTSTLFGTGLNFAVPVNALRALLARPIVTIDEVPEVPYEKRYDPVDLGVEVVLFTGTTAPLSVEVVLGAGKNATPRNFRALPAGGNRYTVRVSPLAQPQGGLDLLATVDSADGSIRCRLADQPLRLDEQSYPLSQVTRVERKPEGVTLVLRDGRQISGKALSGGPLRAQFGGRGIELEWSTVNTVAIGDPEPEPAEVEGKVIVRQGDQVLTEQATRLRIAPRPTAAAAAVTPAPPGPAGAGPTPLAQPAAVPNDPDAGPADLPSTKLTGPAETRLPGKFTDVRVGAGGRYLIFRFKEPRELAVFDVSSGQVVKELPLPTDDVVYAAGADKLMVILTTQGLLQRWSLVSFERERTAALQGAANVKLAMVGPRSRGPLMLWSGGTLQPLDLETLAPIRLEGLLGGDPQHWYRLRGSFNGQVFTGWHAGLSPDPTRMMRIEDGRGTQVALPGEMSHVARWQVPNGNGSYLFDHGGAMRDAYSHKDVAGDALHGSTLIPCLDDRYFLALKGGTLTLCTTCDRRPIYLWNQLDELKGANGYASDNEPRIYFFPTANLLLTLPESNDRVVLRPFELASALTQWGVDYLYVDSLPPHRLRPGTSLNYQLTVHSKAGGVKLRLENGPDGMKLSDTGLVTWTPTRPAQEPVPVAISVADASGQEFFHTFELTVAGRR